MSDNVLRAIHEIAQQSPMGFADADAVKEWTGLPDDAFSEAVRSLVSRDMIDNRCPVGSLKLSHLGLIEAKRLR